MQRAEAKVHRGFLQRYKRIADSLEYQSALNGAFKTGRIVFTGHSLGGAVAVLAALDCKER